MANNKHRPIEAIRVDLAQHDAQPAAGSELIQRALIQCADRAEACRHRWQRDASTCANAGDFDFFPIVSGRDKGDALEATLDLVGWFISIQPEPARRELSKIFQNDSPSSEAKAQRRAVLLRELHDAEAIEEATRVASENG